MTFLKSLLFLGELNLLSQPTKSDNQDQLLAVSSSDVKISHSRGSTPPVSKVFSRVMHDDLDAQGQPSLLPRYLKATAVLKHRLHLAELSFNLLETSHSIRYSFCLRIYHINKKGSSNQAYNYHDNSYDNTYTTIPSIAHQCNLKDFNSLEN